MCGRYLLTLSSEALIRQLDAAVLEPLVWEPRYNIAPTQLAPVLVAEPSGERSLRLMHWGLVPSWSKDTSFSQKTINCRSETAAEKPAFRDAFKAKRCIVPVSGFYEWKREGKYKQPYLIRHLKQKPLWLAGLWESWRVRDSSGRETGEIHDSFTILTTAANPFIQSLHERMPKILDSQELALWLNPLTPMDQLKKLASTPYAADGLEMFAVSRKLNSPQNEGPQLIERAPHQPSLLSWAGVAFISTVLLGSCALHPTRPCSDGGDVGWRTSQTQDGKITGDKHCIQKRGADGKFRNHGQYRVTYPNGKLALEGRFEEGRKEGVWSEYNEKGEKIAERYYESGVEKTPPAKK